MHINEKVIFAQGPSKRKKVFALSTIITQAQDGTYHSYKRAATPEAIAHAQAVAGTYTYLQQVLSASKSLSIAPATIHDDTTVEIAYATGVPLEQAIVDAILENRQADALQLVALYCDQVTATLPALSCNPAKNADYVAVFGDAYNHPTACFKYGLVDLNFDNLFLADGKLTLIDYEWFFDFPVPKEFILGRSLHYLFIRYASSMKTIFIEGTEFVSLSDECFVPDYIYNKYQRYFAQLDRILSTEGSFQEWTSDTPSPYAHHLYPEPKRVTHPISRPMPIVYNELARIHQDTSVHVRNLEDIIKQQQLQLESLSRPPSATILFLNKAKKRLKKRSK
jgi:hypothetical protein